MKFLHPSPKSSSRGITILRVAFGAMLLVHGVQKFTAGHAAFAASVAAMGVQKPDIIAWLVIAGELGLGLLLVLGALTRVAGFLAAILIGSIWFVTEAGKPLLTDASGVTAELLIIYFAIAVSLIFLGPGALSLDRKLAKQPARR
ncbi:DoxX family protein [Paenarthrobacter ureafaciens]|uniref:DoxX family protein n=1 Tax=Paenarthrobacter TaxID=1742992 RepID=UPI0015BE141A|nr:DoxX family protein [Paenarthrobacter sp. PAE-2]MCW3765040.1 DoxX family protein [Paenarthrobacter sp. PAE-2]NWL26030.1 DoxX family protein [Paenarthrobacter ureafaciens]BCW83386.1 hypothetical protein NicSoilE8_10590 [Arthrobacter sp. NicSoilE8]